MHESISTRLMIWVRKNLDDRGEINRWQVKKKANEMGLRTANHLYGTENPRMIKVEGTQMARPI